MRFVEFRYIQRKQLMEDARIQHAEDFLFYDGSAGAVRVLNSLEKLEKGVGLELSTIQKELNEYKNSNTPFLFNAIVSGIDFVVDHKDVSVLQVKLK